MGMSVFCWRSASAVINVLLALLAGATCIVPRRPLNRPKASHESKRISSAKKKSPPMPTMEYRPREH